MQKTHPRTLRYLMRRRPGLNALRIEVQRQDRLLKTVRALLEPALGSAVVAARNKGSQLILHVNSAARATQLRYLAPFILSGARRSHPALGSVKIRVTLATGRPAKRAPAPTRIIPRNAVRIIRKNAAESISNPIRQALERLADTLEKRSRDARDQEI